MPIVLLPEAAAAPQPPPPVNRVHLWRGGLIVLLVVVVYGGGMRNAFQYDDIHSITENPHIRSLANIPAFFVDSSLFSVDPRNAMYRPLVLVSYALNFALSGTESWSYHLANLGLHVANSLLVYALVLQLGQPGQRAFIAAALFALCPLASESVNYISSRSETLCALFVLVGFLSFVRGSSACRLGAVVCFAAALLAKSVALALVPVLLAYELAFGRRGLSFRDLALRHGGFWLVGALYLIGIRGAIGTAMFAQPVRSLDIHVLTQLKALVFYLRLLWMPQSLNIEHQFALAGGLAEGPVVFALLLLAALGGALLVCGAREVAFWVWWALMTLAPSTLVPLNILVNEHRLYLPLVAFSVLLAGVLHRLVEERGRIGVGLVVTWLAVCGVLSWQRTRVWESPGLLWNDALRKAPRMPRPHIFVADWLQEKGDLEEALRHYALARTVYPPVLSGADLVVSYNNEGRAHLALGRRAEAAASFRRALAIDPSYSRSREALDALVAFEEQRWDPDAHNLHKQGLMLLIANRPAQAVAALEKSLQVQVRLETYRALGMAFEQLGQIEEQRRVYTILRQLAPDGPFGQGAAAKLRELEGRK